MQQVESRRLPQSVLAVSSRLLSRFTLAVAHKHTQFSISHPESPSLSLSLFHTQTHVSLFHTEINHDDNKSTRPPKTCPRKDWDPTVPASAPTPPGTWPTTPPHLLRSARLDNVRTPQKRGPGRSRRGSHKASVASLAERARWLVAFKTPRRGLAAPASVVAAEGARLTAAGSRLSRRRTCRSLGAGSAKRIY